MAESPTMEVRARLTADSAQFTKGLQEASKSAENFQGAATKLNSALVGLGAVAGGTAIALIAFATKSFKAAAEVQELDIALQAIGKSTRYGYVQLALAVEAIKDVGITSAAANRAVIKLAQSNVDLGDATELATIAQNLSVTASVNASDALQTLTFAITTGQTRMLRQIGITTGATEAFALYGRTIGKSASDLSMAERRQAVLNFILKEGTKVTGAYALAIQSPSKALKEMSDLTNNLQVAVGKRLLDSFSKVILATFELYTRFTTAANGTGTFSKFLDAMQKVLTKLADPFAKIATNLGNFIDKIDKSKLSVNGIASVMEKILPIAVGFTTFFGIKAGKSLAQAAPFFQGFFAMLSKYAYVYTLFAVALTSPQLRGALGQLVAAFKPLAPTVTNLGKIFTEISTLALGLFASAIRGVAAIVTQTTEFFQNHKTILYILVSAFAAVTLGVIAYTIQTKLAAAATNLKTSALKSLNKMLLVVRSTTFLYVVAIATLVAAFAYAWKNSEVFRTVVTEVFNSVAQTIGKALSFILTGIGNLLISFGLAMSSSTSFGNTMISVFQFVYTTTLTAIQGVIKTLIMLLSALAFVTSEHTAFGQVVRAVLNFVFKAFATVVGGILKFIGLFLEGLGNLLDTHGIVGKVIGAVLDFLFKTFATVVGGIIKFIGMFVKFLGDLLDTHSIVGKAIARVLDFLLDAFALVFGGIFKYIGMFISFLGNLLDANSLIGTGIAKIINFIASIYFTLVEKVSGFLATLVGALYKFLEGNRETLEIALDLFNNFAKGVGRAISFIPQILGQALQNIGSFVKNLSDTVSGFLDDIAEKLRSNIFTSFLAGPVEALAKGIRTIGNKADAFANSVAKPFITFSSTIQNATKEIISDGAFDNVLSKVGKIRDALLATSKTASTLKEKEFGTDLGNFISGALKNIGGVSQKIGNTILQVTKVPLAEALGQAISDALTSVGGFAKKAGATLLEASDIKLGTALVQMLSSASGIIGGAVGKVGDFVFSLKELEVGDILGNFINSVANLAIPELEKLVNVIEGLKDVEVGKFLVDNLSSLSLQAGATILGFASAMESFTTGDVLGKTTDVFSSFADELKKGLGFGDILEEERKRAEEIAGMNGADDDTLNELQNSADIMKKIREAMAAGIESMRDVLADLQDAAKQFADSLKDTILSFAGLKGVELPDGFIPKAKSLIENMRMRLDKSQQFANQILTLQGLGLDAGAIKDLVESGPIKGAQLAASILGGGVEAIAQINELQQQIGFTGAAIGKFGSDAAFGQQIANAQLGIAKVVDAEARIGAVSGNNIVIEQGAFVVNVDTTGATNQDEKADIITRRIEETFAILAKELANK